MRKPPFLYLIGINLVHKSTREELIYQVMISDYYEDKNKLEEVIKERAKLYWEYNEYDFNGWYIRINFEKEYLKYLADKKILDEKLIKKDFKCRECGCEDYYIAEILDEIFNDKENSLRTYTGFCSNSKCNAKYIITEEYTFSRLKVEKAK